MTEEPPDPGSPGWDAIDAALAARYGGTEPQHFGTLIPWRLGGPDPLDGISAYPRTDPVPHWHLVSYGMSELYGKESDNAAESGWGFELTLRLARGADDAEPPAWALNLLQNLARYVHQSGNWFEPGHHLNLAGPINTDRPDTLLCAAGFVLDPELGTIDTPNGTVRFLQIVGLTAEEYEATQRWNTGAVLDALGTRLPLLVTDLDRASLHTDEQIAATVRAGIAADGSSTGHVHVDVVDFAVRRGRVALTIGAHPAPSVAALLAGRLPYGRPLTVAGTRRLVTFVPGAEFAARAENDTLTLTLAPETVAELTELLRPRRTSVTLDTAPDLTVHIEQSQIRDPATGAVVDTVG